jgi:hypothetical protein
LVRLSPRQATIPGLAVIDPAILPAQIVPELELFDLVSAGRDDLPDPFLPKRRDGMVSSQMIEGHNHQTFVVVGLQGVAAVAQ